MSENSKKSLWDSAVRERALFDVGAEVIVLRQAVAMPIRPTILSVASGLSLTEDEILKIVAWVEGHELALRRVS